MANAFSQVPVYLQAQFNKTIYDRTAGNNPWGIGLGLQTFISNGSKVKPTFEVTADAYLEDDKVLRVEPDHSPINGIGGMVNLFAGLSYQPHETWYLSFVVGPSFTGGLTRFGIKPTLGFYFPENQKWTGKLFLLNIFNRDKQSTADFGSIGLALAIRLF